MGCYYDDSPLARLQRQTGEKDQNVLRDCLESAKAAIMARRYPYQEWPAQLEGRYKDLQYRIALDIYNKAGAEGEIVHSENGVSRTYESSWVSQQLLNEIVPIVGVVSGKTS